MPHMHENHRHMALQLFAEPDPAQEGGEQEKEQDQEKGKPASFTQADMDKLAAKVRAEERKKAEEAIIKARTEGERLARMSEEEKAQAERERREAELEQREKALSLREMRATARDMLGEKGLPAELLDVLDYASADACKASIGSVESAFRAAVQKGVEERMRGRTPEKKSGGTDASAAYLTELRKAAGLKEQKK